LRRADQTDRGPLRILVIGAGVGGISVARGLLRDGHDVTVFERRPGVTAAGGAVTIWSNGAKVLGQLGVDMDGAGQPLSTVRILLPTGRPLTTMDLTAIVKRLGAPVRMVPRQVVLERCWKVSRPIASDATLERSGWSVRATECGSSSKTVARPREIC
jgi:FAD-dependent urate hydroxylase